MARIRRMLHSSQDLLEDSMIFPLFTYSRDMANLQFRVGWAHAPKTVDTKISALNPGKHLENITLHLVSSFS